MAISCGSSFTTVSTIGIAFVGIGTILRINFGLTVGAIVSGAFFGANVSPLSGTTNLAAGIGKINLYTHIKSLLLKDILAFVISLIIYFFLGLGTKANTGYYNDATSKTIFLDLPMGVDSGGIIGDSSMDENTSSSFVNSRFCHGVINRSYT